MDVGPFVIAHAQAAELVQPRERPLDDPPPPAQAGPMLRTAPGEQRVNSTHPQAVPNGRGVVATVAQHTVRTTPRAPASTMEWRNCIHQGQGFLRVISIRAGQADCEWDALRITDQMPFAPALGAVRRIRTGRGASTVRSWQRNGQERLDQIPQ